MAALLLLLLCLLPTLAVSTSDGSAVLEDLKPLPLQAKPFDYFLFVQQWPGTYCESSSACCQSLNSPVEFTIHGLWPNYDDGSWPECCEGAPWSEEEIQPLIRELQKYWPTLSCTNASLCSSNKKGSFWQHEWEKHGTCSSPTISDVHSYFSIGLELQKKYELTKILNAAGFFPSSASKYTTADVVAAIKDYVGATPELSCSSGQIKEIQICLYKDFTPRECGILSASTARYADQLQSSSCPVQVLIPAFTQSAARHSSV